MASDIVMNIGEALVGEGNEIAHIDLLIGSKTGPVGTAFANALANQSEGHTNLLAVLTPNLLAKPATMLITKVTIKGMKQAVQMFGPAQYAVAKAVADSVADGTIPASAADDLVIVCGVFIHPAAEDNAKILKFNYEATKLSIAAGHEEPAHRRAKSPRRKTRSSTRSPAETIRSMKPKILIQLDTDPQPSVFDAVVAVDAGVEHLFRHGGVTPENVRDLVYGALFTRGPADLSATAIFIGGSNVAAGEAVLEEVKKTFFGPFKVSVLFDANGANTTAAAAVLAALQSHGGSLEGVTAAVLAATGPVGQRVARLLCRLGAKVAVGSRSLDRAAALAETLRQTTGRTVTPFAASSDDELAKALDDSAVIVSAGAAGVTLLPAAVWRNLPKLKALIDLNAVPPLGIEGVEATDKNTERDHVRAWGARASAAPR